MGAKNTMNEAVKVLMELSEEQVSKVLIFMAGLGAGEEINTQSRKKVNTALQKKSAQKNNPKVLNNESGSLQK